MARYYVDTSIWRDYFENRSDRFRPLGEWAFEFFRLCKENKYLILYSDLIVRELTDAYSEKKIKEMMEIVSDYGLLQKVKEPTEKQFEEAKKLKGDFNISFTDILHAILARDNNSILIYRDVHYHQLQKIVNIKKPEEII